ncbi:MazG nucleotide pyrophosphohydrolase domain-containing protein [Duncaniella muris]|jgi:NTP pyrophosphatase (non-canonical NTP hydrolase)|uniref:MazG nucleotide pyrophosphohydrolase domain-containing protein n=1 Tax=Duncaniella muris TaxID=2094150 RepID=UPI00272B032C|nr:MazG nucleotide pyrophosphohydrolase domain-containing protein [Duncaniella muris]
MENKDKPLSTEIPQMSDKEFEDTIRLAIKTYGKEAQTQMLFEEMSELQNALCKLARNRGTADQVCEEIADVMIMCLQMAHIYGTKRIEQWANRKMIRLKDRLNHDSQTKA